MSLFYGPQILAQSDGVRPKDRGKLNYIFLYETLVINKIMYSVEKKSGYPYTYAYCHNLDDESKFTLTMLKFQGNKTVTECVCEFYLQQIMKDGSHRTKKIPGGPYDIGSTRAGSSAVLPINKSFKFKDVDPDYRDIVAFHPRIKRINALGYGSTSVLGLVVEP